ncbi:hypothetical protein [Segetibacter sp.]|jgi:hypothetical protein|uniref:hypothetical protein n=1 Tax=Segetibacter sp. TaxID=2231182 RepID=UPI002631BF01|nr:hypothetical protein [Segetibacter sp.]MCW3081159.1 hypothetical protein [Segetibacter sp.]
MEDNLNHDEFEEFLQDQVRNHRMYPADAVWREIDKKLHGEKRWPALTIAAALLVSATVLICVYFSPKPNLFSLPTADVNTFTKQTSQKDDILGQLTPSDPFAKAKQIAGSSQISSPAVATSSLRTSATPVSDFFIDNHTPGNLVPIHVRQKSLAPLKLTQIAESPLREIGGSEKIIDLNDALIKDFKEAEVVRNNIERSKELKVGEVLPAKNNNNSRESSASTNIPLPPAFAKQGLKHKFSYQIYVAPSVSYRKLMEDNSMTKENTAGPVGVNFVTDVNKVVRHKPGTGIEAGFSIMYGLSNKVRVKSGFQFNMRQYSIQAYRSNTELASIALVGNNRIDTINTLAIYRVNNGYYSAQLVNRYYQLSVPVGIEWEIIGNKRVQLNVAGTIQPTYLLNRNAYLLSTNFKNYTENPGMVRQWNINSNIEAFVSFKAGDFKWQVGPQLRYQPYSTFIPEYTIKEHLMDYGIKLGVSKAIY